MKKNMFNVIKVTVIIAVLLTTCNIGVCKAQNYKVVTNVGPYFHYQTVNKEEEIPEEEEIIVSEDELVVAEEENNNVMGEVNNVNTYVEPIEENIVVEEPVQTNTYYNNDFAY